MGGPPNPHVVPTSLTWRNPPSNPPGSYLSSSGGPRRRRERREQRRRRRGSRGRLAGTAWATRIAGARSPVSALGEVRRARAAGCRGTCHPQSLSGAPRSGARAGHRVCPSALPARAHSEMLEENLAVESRSPHDCSATRSSRLGRGRPRLPRSPGKKAEDAGLRAPLLPGRSLRGICSPAQIPAAGPLPGRGRARGQAEESSTCHFGRL